MLFHPGREIGIGVMQEIVFEIAGRAGLQDHVLVDFVVAGTGVAEGADPFIPAEAMLE